MFMISLTVFEAQSQSKTGYLLTIWAFLDKSIKDGTFRGGMACHWLVNISWKKIIIYFSGGGVGLLSGSPAATENTISFGKVLYSTRVVLQRDVKSFIKQR